MEEEPKYSKELEDLEERFFQKAKSEKEKAKSDLDERIESFHQKLISGKGVGFVGEKKERLLKRVRESLHDEYVDIPSKGAAEIKERLRDTKHKLDDYETDVRRLQDNIKTLTDKELRYKYLEAKNRLEYEEKLGKE